MPVIKDELDKEQKKKLNKIRKRSQEKNKSDLNRLVRFNNRRNNYKISKQALAELEDPKLVYILGGINSGKYTYIHSHTRTWQTGLRTAAYAMRRMLHELVHEQKNIINARIEEINFLWENKVYRTINEQEKKLGNDIHITNWNDFIKYYNSLPQMGQSDSLTDIVNYKIIQSALSNLKKWRNETNDEYVERLCRLQVINKNQAEEIVGKTTKVTSITKTMTEFLEKKLEEARLQFIGNNRVKAWIDTLDDNSATKTNYGTPEKQITLKPDAKQLGFIAEHSLKSLDDSDVFLQNLSEDIVDAFINNAFEIVQKGSNSTKKAYHAMISGETHGQKGGLDNKINKSDLVISLDLGEISINIPSSVKLSMNIKGIKNTDGIITIKAQDMFSAGASSANLDFSEINRHVNSPSYSANATKINSLIQYVYNNAGAMPSIDMTHFTLFNNSVIYYLAWLELCTKIVGAPNNSQQLAMALESINSIHNTADILKKLQNIQPSQIRDFINIQQDPKDGLVYSGQSSVMVMQKEIDLVIAELWNEFLSFGGSQPDYRIIYSKVYDILARYSGITNKKLPPASIMYRIKLDNIRTLTIKEN